MHLCKINDILIIFANVFIKYSINKKIYIFLIYNKFEFYKKIEIFTKETL